MTWWLWTAVAAAVLYACFLAWLVILGRRGDARAVVGFIPDCVVLVRRMLADDRVPKRSRWLLTALVAYLVMPFDLVPDFIPVAGQLDDVILAVLVLRAVVRSGGSAVVEDLWPGPAASLDLLLRLTHGPGEGIVEGRPFRR